MKKIIMLIIGIGTAMTISGCGLIQNNVTTNTENQTSDQHVSEITEETNPMESDILDGDKQQTDDMDGLTEYDYDLILSQDDNYILCQKTDATFSEAETYYGIWDTDAGDWALEYLTLENTTENENFVYCGDGIYYYNYLDNSGSLYDVFLSPEKNGTFTLHVAGLDDLGVQEGTMREGFWFYGGKVMAWLYLPNHNKSVLCVISADGTYKELDAEQFGGGSWEKMQKTEDYTAYYFDGGEDEKYFLIYKYDIDDFIVINNQEYTSKYQEDCTNVYIEDNLITIDYLLGADGNNYYAIFDLDGNVVQEATLE